MMQGTLQQALVRADESHRLVAVLYLDLDGFKGINDSLGHAAGDLVLIEAAQRMLGCVRSTDTVARLGGDEFVVILEQLDGPQVAGQIAGKLVERVGQPYMLEGQARGGISVSAGLALYPLDAGSAGVLLDCADQAMYRAKQAGGNRWMRASGD